MFLEQLIRTLQAEEAGEHAQSLDISGASGGDGLALSEMGVSAATIPRMTTMAMTASASVRRDDALDAKITSRATR